VGRKLTPLLTPPYGRGILAGMDCLIGLDIGTSGTKGVLLGEHGEPLTTSTVGTPFLPREAPIVEIDPAAYLRMVHSAISELTRAVPHGGRVRGISFSVASGNTLLLDEHGKPLRPIISWLDNRARGLHEVLFGGLDTTQVHQVAGWGYVEGFPLAHLAWLKRLEPERYSRAAHVGMAIDYLYHELTGCYVLDRSTATTFYLYNQRTRDWHDPYLEFLELRRERIAALADSGSPVGTLTASAAKATGLPQDCVVVAGSFDHPAACRATGIVEPGDLLVSLGTSWVSCFPTQDRPGALADGLIVDPFLEPDGPWAAIASLPGFGQSIDAALRRLYPDLDAEAMHAAVDEEVASAPAGAQGCRIDLHEPGPAAEEAARAAAEHGRPVAARAVVESAARALREKFDTLERTRFAPRRVCLVGGPSRSPVWRGIIAAMLGRHVSLLHSQHAGAVGAAILAGVGSGVLQDIGEGFCRYGEDERTLDPDAALVSVYAE
jgi:xylulokinase